VAAATRGGRPARALLVLPLLVLAALHVGVAGELAVLTLVMLSCVALGSLLAAAAGVRELVIASRQPSRQTLVAFATTAFALAQYALSSHGDLPPATVPVAVAMVVAAIAGRLRRRRAQEVAAAAI
jgi:ABC-type Na+ efflux pump permease subunit